MYQLTTLTIPLKYRYDFLLTRDDVPFPIPVLNISLIFVPEQEEDNIYASK